jgi:hypothetical protein
MTDKAKKRRRELAEKEGISMRAAANRIRAKKAALVEAKQKTETDK